MTNKQLDQNELRKTIEKVLWEDWDPISLKECNGPNDEYSGYVPSIFQLLMEGSDASRIAKMLYHHANVNMGLSTELEDHAPSAEKLIEILNGFSI